MVGASPNIVKSQLDVDCGMFGSKSAGRNTQSSEGHSLASVRHASAVGEAFLSAAALGSIGSNTVIGSRSPPVQAVSSTIKVSRPVLDIGYRPGLGKIQLDGALYVRLLISGSGFAQCASKT